MNTRTTISRYFLIFVAIAAVFSVGMIVSAIAQPGEEASAIPADLLAPANVTVLEFMAIKMTPSMMNSAAQCNLLYGSYGMPPRTDKFTWLFVAFGAWSADELVRYVDILMTTGLPTLPAAAWQIQVLDTNGVIHSYSDGQWTQVAN